MVIILASLLLLLVNASVAHAECAWMLWVEAPAGSNQWSVATWVQPPRFGTKEYCEHAATVMNALKKVTDFSGQGRDSAADDAYSCLPDTVDPRGPKGK